MSGGLGGFPFGLLPLGSGVQATATVPPERRPHQARYINPQTRDYERDTDGEFKRMPITRQRVLIALSSILGSGDAAPDLGLDLPKKIDETYERRVQLRVRAAVQHLVDDGSLRIRSVVVSDTGVVGRTHVVFNYHDNLIGANDTVNV